MYVLVVNCVFSYSKTFGGIN